MATPKGIRAKTFPINATDAVHIYSDPSKIWLQLRREHPTENDIGITSFKAALRITPIQAIAIAGELLSVATSHQKNGTIPVSTIPSVPAPENHGKPWTPEEDKQLLSRFHSNLSIEDIAKKHKRGIGGIQSRLAKHGKITPNNKGCSGGEERALRLHPWLNNKGCSGGEERALRLHPWLNKPAE